VNGTMIRLALIASALAVTLAGCGGDGEAVRAQSAGAQASDPAKDKLAQIQARGTLVAYYGTDYPPQSMAAEGATRAAQTKCAENQLTADAVTGFDIETTKVVAKGLGVEPCFGEFQWTEVTSGNWGDRWDIAYGSGSISRERMAVLLMTQPYYAVPNDYFVAADSPIRDTADLKGKRIGDCTSAPTRHT